jgi:hypothetical protein
MAVERRVVDPAAPTDPDRKIDPDFTGRVSVRPQTVLATDENRLQVERTAREAALERQRASYGYIGGDLSNFKAMSAATLVREPIPVNMRREALDSVDEDLAEAGIIERRNGRPTKGFVAELSWEREELLPTPGIIVKGCLDECDTCEPTRLERIGLALEERRLKNKMLKRQIELLEKAQEYRCCPAGPTEEDSDDS